jgi:putative protease
MEETRPGQYLPVEEDDRGSYVLNSRDLCLVEHLPQLIAAGVNSLKIEGRMKSRYYVAAVTRVYRAALDRYLEHPEAWRCDPRWRRALEKVSHRPYGTGFLLGRDDPRILADQGGYRRECDFVGVVEQVRGDGRARVAGRNRFFAGETLELIGPGMRQACFEVTEMTGENGAPLSVVQPNARALMSLPEGARPGDLLRRERKDG